MADPQLETLTLPSHRLPFPPMPSRLFRRTSSVPTDSSTGFLAFAAFENMRLSDRDEVRTTPPLQRLRWPYLCSVRELPG